ELACAGVPVQTGWLFAGRAAAPVAAPKSDNRPIWTVDGQLVRDRNGEALPGGMTPPRQVEVLTMTAPQGNGSAAVHDSRADLVSEYLRTSRDLIATQRDELLAFLGDGSGGGRMVWQPAETAPVQYQATQLEVAPMAAVAPLVPMPSVVPVSPVPMVAPVPTAMAMATAVAAPGVDVQGAVLAVISERTGYPEELIELDLDLEADLSVDSIKRAEVAGEVANRLGLSVEGDESELEELVKARTVRSMVTWLDAKINSVPEVVGAAPFVPEAPVAEPPAAANPGIAPQRLIGILEPAPATATAPALAGARFLITGGAAAGALLAELLAGAGATGVSAGPDADPAGYDGIVLLDGLTDGAGPLLPDAFGFLKNALAAGPKWLVAAGPEGGGARVDGMPGLFRTLAREYPEVIARYVEVPADGAADEVAGGLIEELRDGTPAAIVHRRADGRMIEQLVPAGLGALADGGAGPAGEGASEAQAIGLDADSVVVLIGGARGITPWFARTVAGGARCRIELVGRTPLPQNAEDPELAAAGDKAALRSALARRGMRSPAEIDRTASGILAAREVGATVAELEELGAQVRYHSLDVRDDEATHRLIKQICDEYGHIDGLVYAAGVIEDKLVADKDPASFERVFRTKVDGARSVLDALDASGAEPKFVVMFGSIAAAYGNRGQSDYAAANDALDTMGTRWSQETGRRAVTVHWGPWAASGIHGGMVTPELTAEYARRGIGLIDPEEGALSLLRELAWGDSATTSVVLTASGW
ncbi:MAG: hypothetical protein QOG46_2157, partial [Pseudonocardiales bacterium]|nr:hypothetical protein [Pseudonocardiales bacterium]